MRAQGGPGLGSGGNDTSSEMAHDRGGSGADAGHGRTTLRWLTTGAQRSLRAWNENERGPPFL